jgi:hypothetical protein
MENHAVQAQTGAFASTFQGHQDPLPILAQVGFWPADPQER